MGWFRIILAGMGVLFVGQALAEVRIPVTNRTDIRCVTGECRDFCADDQPMTIHISTQCDGHYDYSLQPGQTRIIALHSETDYGAFCLEDGHQQLVKLSAAGPIALISWRGLRLNRPILVAVGAHQAFSKPIFSDQVNKSCNKSKNKS